MAHDRTPYVQLLRSLPDSEKINAVSEGAECLFVRLLASVDDAGRFPADPTWIACKIFTARMISGQVEAKVIANRLDELEDAGLIERYVVAGKAYLRIVNHFRQNRTDVKVKELFPGPDRACNESDPHSDRGCNGSVTDSSRDRIERVSLEENREDKTNGALRDVSESKPARRKGRGPGPLAAITEESMRDTGKLIGHHRHIVNLGHGPRWLFTPTDASRIEFIAMAISALDFAEREGGDAVKVFAKSITERRRFVNCPQEDRARELFRDWQRQKSPALALAGVADSNRFEMPEMEEA